MRRSHCTGDRCPFPARPASVPRSPLDRGWRAAFPPLLEPPGAQALPALDLDAARGKDSS